MCRFAFTIIWSHFRDFFGGLYKDMLLTLHGKGRKNRKSPFSFSLRKALFKFIEGKKGRLFHTTNGTPWHRLNALKSVKFHCKERIGFEPPPRTVHAMRHTAATNFVASGGSPFHLMRLLGHSTLTMSNRYVNLSTGDLAETHQRVSLLNA